MKKLDICCVVPNCFRTPIFLLTVAFNPVPVEESQKMLTLKSVKQRILNVFYPATGGNVLFTVFKARPNLLSFFKLNS